MIGALAGDQLERVLQRRLDQLEPVTTASRRARKVHDQRVSPYARETSAEQPVRRAPDRVGAQRLGYPRNRPVEDGLGRLRCEVSRRDSGSAGGQDKRCLLRELANRRGDLRAFVGYDAMLDLVPLGLKELDEQSAALVLALPRDDAVGNGQDGAPQTGSLDFSTSATSVTDISLSIAFAMS